MQGISCMTCGGDSGWAMGGRHMGEPNHGPSSRRFYSRVSGQAQKDTHGVKQVEGHGGDGARYHGQLTGRWKPSVRLPKEGCDLRGPWRRAGL